MRATLAILALLPSCSLVEPHNGIVVDVSARTLTMPDGTTMPVETARRGVGSTYGSKKTPLGEFVVYRRQEKHRFSRCGVGVLRMHDPVRAGKTRHEPGARGVHLHRNMDGTDAGTNGCICPIHFSDMRHLWKHTAEGTRITIKL